MSTSKVAVRMSVAVVCLILLCVSVQAQLGRAFVSTKGDDANSCGPTAPCRSFAKALTVLLPRGEIVALDSGGYSSAIITQSVSIYVPLGIHAGVTASTGSALTIDAGPDDVVVLRGVHLNGTGAMEGIRVNSVGTLYVENCQITGFSGNGVSFFAGNGKLVMKATDVRQCGVSGVVLSSLDLITAFISECNISGCLYGVLGYGRTVSTIANSVATNNDVGFYVANPTTSNSSMTLAHVRAVNNTTGILASRGSTGTATISFAYSLISQNGTGVSTDGGLGTVNGTNPGTSVISGNATDVSGTLSAAMTLY